MDNRCLTSTSRGGSHAGCGEKGDGFGVLPPGGGRDGLHRAGDRARSAAHATFGPVAGLAGGQLPAQRYDWTGIRVTPNVYTTIGEVDTFIGAMQELVKQ